MSERKSRSTARDRRVPPTRRLVLDVAQMRAADRAAIDGGVAGRTLMERAGAGVAAEIGARWGVGRAVVLCGPGNNGGDGYVVARRLTEAGWTVRLAALVEPAGLKGDAADAAGDWAGGVFPLADIAFEEGEIVVDALFGAGLSHALDGQAEAALRRADAGSGPLVAVDLPSGLSGDTGRPLGFAPHADLTVTFHARKLGHVLEPGRSLCGEVVVVDIGLSDPLAELWEGVEAQADWPQNEK